MCVRVRAMVEGRGRGEGGGACASGGGCKDEAYRASRFAVPREVRRGAGTVCGGGVRAQCAGAVCGHTVCARGDGVQHGRARPRMAIFLTETVLNIELTMLRAKRAFCQSFITMT